MSGLTRRERELKIATHDLVDDLHGFEAAGSYIDRAKSVVHRWASVEDAETFMPLRFVAELERRASRPFVTIALCKMAGGVFLKLPADFGDAGALPVHVMELAHEVGDVSARVCEAMKDGAVTGAEAAGVEIELDQLIDKAVQARALVRAMQGKPAAEVRPVPINAGPMRSRES